MPAPGLANAHLQSALASSSLRALLVRPRAAAFTASATREALTTPDGVRLEAWINEHPAARGVALLFHGWEGHAAASYMVETGMASAALGCHVVRLNFRDHGATHGLNEELFHSCRLAEVVAATELVGARWPSLPMLLAGFSLGGNFALRVARHARTAIAALVAVSPVIDPARALAAIEGGLPVYHSYFMRKWRRSLRRKGELFPDRYGDISHLKLGLRDLTAWLVERHSEFPSLDAYLDGYAIGGDRLADLPVPATLLAARDDPVIPSDDFDTLTLPPHAELRLEERGGHCGFIENWRFESWAVRCIGQRFEAALAGGDGPR